MTGADAIAIGQASSATQAGAVALGQGSMATRAGLGATPEFFTQPVTNSANGAVSVGPVAPQPPAPPAMPSPPPQAAKAPKPAVQHKAAHAKKREADPLPAAAATPPP